MVIQWYPGHMDKALRQMGDNIKLVDAVIYVLDSRAPYSCLNPKYKEIIGDKPMLFVLNKADLVEEKELVQWEALFSEKEFHIVKLNSTITNTTKVLLSKIEKLLSEKIKRNQAKGVHLPLRLMVIGVPNCGKSTLINNVCSNKKTETGDRAGVTRSNQWVKIAGNYEMLDTPGTLWPSFENDKVARNLAYIGSIKDEVLDMEELAFAFLNDIKIQYFQNLVKRYNLKCDINSETISLFDEICLNRGFKLRGNDIDYGRGARAIIDDFRKGRIGKIILDDLKDLKNVF